MNVLGISAFYHDSAVAVVQDGDILAAAQEERFTRKKHDSSFPRNALAFCLDFTALSIDDMDAVVFYDKPFLKFERLLETYYSFAPKGLRSFFQAIPVWMREKIFLKDLIFKELSRFQKVDRRRVKLLFPEHHLSHAASAFYPSPFQKAAILTIDGVGEWATASIGLGDGDRITILKELRFPHSLGLLYSAFTYYLGFIVNSGEYKLMGLAPYGIPGSQAVSDYVRTIKEKVVDIKEDGSIWLDQEGFNYATGLRMVKEHRWEKWFGFKRRTPDEKIEQSHCDLALAIQIVTEEIVMKMASEAKRLTQAENLCMAGGVALNCVANGKLLKSGLFKGLFIQPAAGDAGGALGAALAVMHIYLKKPRVVAPVLDGMKGAYLGPEYSETEIEKTAKRCKASYRRFDDFDTLTAEVADRLAKGRVVGWFQGRMEFGPRALGNRSILGDARNPEMQKKLNLKIKYREGFRPFAPSVLDEDKSVYFDLGVPSPYMLLIADVEKTRWCTLPEKYFERPLMERLYIQRSDIPAVTHIDFSARIQIVHRQTNEPYWKLIEAFKKKTGYGVIINTSFNVRGEPIVCSPDHAYRCFMRTEMDDLVMGPFLFEKTEQPAWDEKGNWREEFHPD